MLVDAFGDVEHAPRKLLTGFLWQRVRQRRREKRQPSAPGLAVPVVGANRLVANAQDLLPSPVAP
jgi:hypothetical protein